MKHGGTQKVETQQKLTNLQLPSSMRFLPCHEMATHLYPCKVQCYLLLIFHLLQVQDERARPAMFCRLPVYHLVFKFRGIFRWIQLRNDAEIWTLSFRVSGLCFGICLILKSFFSYTESLLFFLDIAGLGVLGLPRFS